MTKWNIGDCSFCTDTQPARCQWTQQQLYDAVYKGDWRNWAEGAGRSAEDVAMTHGPVTSFKQYMTADYQAVKFSCSKAEQNRVTCNSLVLVRHTCTEESAASEPALTTPYVGRVKVWMRHTPPWVSPDASEQEVEEQSQMIADVKWYKYKGIQPGLYNSPVVSKNFWNYPDGNFEFCDAIEPIAMNVVPYIGRNFPVASSQQVISTDVAVFKPNMD